MMVIFVIAIDLFSSHCSLETGLDSESASASGSVGPEIGWLFPKINGIFRELWKSFLYLLFRS